MFKEAITFEPLEVQLQRRAVARLLEDRLQVNAAFCCYRHYGEIELRLSVKDRIGRGAFADVFAPPPGNKAFKLFRRREKTFLAGLAPHVFRSQTAAYEIAREHPTLKDHVPAYYGPISVEAVVDKRGRNINWRYWMDLCYAMERLTDDPEERKFGSFFNAEEWQQMAPFEKAFEDAGIAYLGDASVFHWRSGHPILIDFATFDAAEDSRDARAAELAVAPDRRDGYGSHHV